LTGAAHAGAKYKMEEIRRTIEGVIKRSNLTAEARIILFIDEIHTLNRCWMVEAKELWNLQLAQACLGFVGNFMQSVAKLP